MKPVASLLGVALVAIACQTSGTVPTTIQSGLESALVIRAHDGDSGLLEIDGAEIEFRLHGVNSPEQDECFYEEAGEHLTDRVEGRTVAVETTGTDQFGRALAYLWFDEALVNLDLVTAGFAVATTPGSGDAHGASILAAEQQAASEGRGLWSEAVCGGTGALPEIEVDTAGSNFDPEGRDEEILGQEWVTFRSEVVSDLGGWILRDESSAHRCLLPANTRIGPDLDLTVTSADPCWDPGASPVWNNGGDLVLLLDESGRVAAMHRYGD